MDEVKKNGKFDSVEKIEETEKHLPQILCLLVGKQLYN